MEAIRSSLDVSVALSHSAALSAGDAVAICTAGAYGAVMASEYNVRARPAEWVVDTAEAVACWAAQPLLPQPPRDGAGVASDADVEATLRRPGAVIALGGGRAAACSARGLTEAELVRALATGGFVR